MNLEKVVFGFFLVLALTLNVSFVSSSVAATGTWLLFAAVVVNFIATILKLGDRSQIGALLLATALVADVQLVAAALLWLFADGAAGPASILPLAIGAVVANAVSVTLLVGDTLMSGR